jgi:hypothetical protein
MTAVLGVAIAACGHLTAAQASQGVTSAVLACKAIADDRARLQCLDAVLAEIAAAADEAAARSASPKSLVDRERDVARREAELNAKSEAVAEAASLLRKARLPASVDELALTAIGLPREDVERGDDGSVDAVTANIRSWSYTGRGQIIVLLDNGQVWRQTDAIPLQLANGRSKPHRARISRAAFGSFKMTVNGHNQAYKVRRLEPPRG